MGKKRSTLATTGTAFAAAFLFCGLVYSIGEEPEFAQEDHLPKGERRTHTTNKWRELVWWIFNPHGERGYDVISKGNGLEEAWKRCMSNSD